MRIALNTTPTNSTTTTPSTSRLCFVGDLMVGRKVSEWTKIRQPQDFWGDVGAELNAADAVLGNLESPITNHPGRWSDGWKAFRFRADPAVTDVLRAANVRAVNLANNHMMDFGARGLADTLQYLDYSGIAGAGAGLDLQDAWTPTIFQAGSLKVGLIGITDNMPEYAARSGKPGTAYLPINTEPPTLALVARQIEELRKLHAETIVLSIHWGPNLRTWPPARFRAFARAAIDLGIDIVHGHSAHLVQGIEIHNGGLILYDTGDFLDDYWVFPGFRTDQSFAFFVDYSNGRPEQLVMVPVCFHRGSLKRARGTEFIQISQRMRRRSLRLGTVLEQGPDRLSARIAPPTNLNLYRFGIEKNRIVPFTEGTHPMPLTQGVG